MASGLRRFLTNVVCGLVYNKDARKKVRVVLNSPMLEYIAFIRRDTGIRAPRIKAFIGYQARSLILGVNNKWVYKFPLRRDNYRELAAREERIVSALSHATSVCVPPVELIEYKGRLIRKYKFVPGVTLRAAPVELVMKHIDTLAVQVAQFLYDVAATDPDEIRDLKPSPDAAPGYMQGWFQGDICDNFMFDPKTMKLTAFIDWEDAAFMNFEHLMHREKRTPAREFMLAVEREYKKIWSSNHPE